NDEALKDGQYLKAKLSGIELENVFQLNNALILEDNMVFIAEDNKLKLQPVKVLNYDGQMAIVSGLENGQIIIDQAIASAYPGMPIKIIN
ncbi:MAG: hypothetical protein AAF901_10640, partial [Bacteroidota bacterium]